jgi:hypothetical protein
MQVGGGGGPGSISLGGCPGDIVTLPNSGSAPVPGSGQQGVTWTFFPVWGLTSQRWSVALVPATLSNLPAILQTIPQTPGAAGQSFQPPNLGGLQSQDIQQISPH